MESTDLAFGSHLRVLLAVAFLASLLGCEPPDTLSTFVRVENRTSAPLADVSIERVSFGSLSVGAVSGYLEVPQLWQDVRGEVVVHNRTVELSPVDILSAPERPAGFYRVVLLESHDPQSPEIIGEIEVDFPL